jgi:MoxR-like ATPase
MATEYESAGPAPGQDLDDPEHVAAVAEVAQQRQVILQEIKKVIVGQDKVIEELLIALLARGHCLLVGVPGLAKTLLISTLANVLHLRFNRIQFTPDLMPSDITGTDILEEDPKTRHRHYLFLQGPIFANIVLADEINRTPPKTQAALLQAMQEYRVTAGGRTYNLDLPFFVLATQNPIEQEGTYPLPEAQLDRFMFHIGIDYPSFDEEIDVVQNSTSAYTPQLQRVLSAAKILPAGQGAAGPGHALGGRLCVRLAQGSRPNHPEAPSFIKEWVNWGAGPRASQYLCFAAKRVPSCTGALRFRRRVRALAPRSCAIVS